MALGSFYAVMSVPAISIQHLTTEFPIHFRRRVIAV